MTEKTAAIQVGDRRVAITGAHEQYIDGLEGYNFDTSPVGLSTLEIPHGALCLDVGANIGVMCIPLAARRPDLRIMAFEPIPSNAELLRRNIRANDVANVEVIEAAAGEEAGELHMTDQGPWSLALPDAQTLVKVLRLDDAVSSAVAFMKVDAEGYEPNVFAGANRVLSSRPLIVAEFNLWTLLMHHYDALTYAQTLFSSFEINKVFYGDRPVPTAKTAQEFLLANLTKYCGVNDILMRPVAPIPSVSEMTNPSQHDLNRILESRSWRITAPARALSGFLRSITTAR